MKNIIRRFIALFLITFMFSAGLVASTESPRMGIVISKTSYELGDELQNNAMAWGAVAHLSGIPYSF